MKINKKFLTGIAVFSIACNAYGMNVYESDTYELNLGAHGALGAFNSNKSYAGFSLTDENKQRWYEGYIIYGADGKIKTSRYGNWEVAANLFAGGNRGNPDAVGFTKGGEKNSSIEDAYIKWSSGNLISLVGYDGLKISAGRQDFKIGNGFLVNNDMVYAGRGLAHGFSRGGGTIYLGGRSSFSNTAIIEVGQDTGVKTKLFWLKSNNKFQSNHSLAGSNIEYTDTDMGTVGLTYLRGLDVSNYAANIMGNGYREKRNTWSFYVNGSMGVDGLQVEAEYVDQDKGRKRNTNFHDGNGHAWYALTGWTFSDTKWMPSLAYRFTHYSDNYDPLFYGATDDVGTWFQGEVASTYAGPFNTASDIHMLKFTLFPKDNLLIGANAYRYLSTPNKSQNGSEFDLYLWYGVNKYLSITPLVGIYRPEKTFKEGGSQLGDSKNNIYSELLINYQF